MDVQGRIQAVLEHLVDDGREVGLQVAAYLDGELVVDAWAGAADRATGRGVDGDSLFPLLSCGKGVTATAVHLLVDRGLLDYDMPVATLWPEFAGHGKQHITLRQVLNHSAGVPHLPPETTPGDLCDWDRMCAVIAESSPLWEPGTQVGYHALTYGYILGEVVRRADGRTIDQVVRDEVTGPLGIADSLVYGITDAMASRVAVVVDDAPEDPAARPPLLKAIMPEALAVTMVNRPDVLRACVPSGCTGSARALARLYAFLAQGGRLAGVHLMSPARVATASALASDTTDAMSGNRTRRALGYGVGGTDDREFGHGGAGGSLGWAVPDHNFAFALAKNNLTADPREPTTTVLVTRELRAALSIPA